MTDLSGPLHKIFDRTRWKDITQADYDLLRPSIQLASHLLEVGMPYLTNFLPSKTVHDQFHSAGLSSYLEQENEKRYKREYCVRIKDVSQVTSANLQAAAQELEDLAEAITWKVNKTMLRDNRWIGITRCVPDSAEYIPWQGNISPEDIGDEDTEFRHLPRRPLILGIMQEYVDALRTHLPKTEPHLRARFLCGYTMAHEIGHAVYWQDFSSIRYNELGMEPYVGNDEVAELGSAFMSRIFGGFDPNVREICDSMFTTNLVWTQQAQQNWSRTRSLYRRQWAVGLRFMEDILNQSVWDGIAGEKGTIAWSTACQIRFTPNINAAASATQAEYSLQTGLPEWKGYIFSTRRIPRAERPPVTRAHGDWLFAQPEAPFTRRSASDKAKEKARAIRLEKSDNSGPVANLVKIDMDNLPVRRIDDGVLGREAGGSGLGSEKATRIEVRYRVGSRQRTSEQSSSSKKKLRSGDEDVEDDDYDDIPNHAKRVRSSTYDPEDEVAIKDRTDEDDSKTRFGDEDYDCNDVADLLRNKTVEAVTALTVGGAFQYFQKNGISHDPDDLPDDFAGQQQRLGEISHRGLIERIRQFNFLRAEERFKDDPHALVAIKETRLRALGDWDPSDVQDHAEMLVQRVETHEENLNLIRAWYQADLNTYKEKVKQSAEPDKEYVNFDNSDDDPRDWPPEDLRAYCRIEKLPYQGDRLTRQIRITRHQIEKATGQPISRKRINCDAEGPVKRTDVDNVETYAWTVLLRYTRVEDVKTQLYKTALFPPDAIMHLYFGTDQTRFLHDDEFLAKYNRNGADWTDLWVILTLGDSDPDWRAEQTKAVYQARSMLNPTGSGGTGSLRANSKGKIVDLAGEAEGGSGSGIRGREILAAKGPRKSKAKNPTVIDLTDLSDDEPPAHIKRQAVIDEDPQEKTIGEMMSSVANTQARTARVLQPQGGIDASLKPNGAMATTASGAEILDNIEDMEEEEEDRKNLVRHQNMDPAERQKYFRPPATQVDIADDDGGGLAPSLGPGRKLGSSGSHMRDIYRVLPEGKKEEGSPPSLPSSP